MRGKAVLPDGNTVTYRDYLASSVWRARRAAFLSGRSGLCEICRTSPVVDVHHKSYRTLGWELDHHLAGLCRECHVDLTAAVADAGWWRNWDITQTWIRNGKPEQTEGNDG